MIRMFVGVAMLVATPAFAADQVACTINGHPYYDPDFCKAIAVSHEALDLNRKLIDKSEEIRQMIDRQLKQELNKRRGM